MKRDEDIAANYCYGDAYRHHAAALYSWAKPGGMGVGGDYLERDVRGNWGPF